MAEAPRARGLSRSLVSRWLSRVDQYASRPLAAIIVVTAAGTWIIVSIAAGGLAGVMMSFAVLSVVAIGFVFKSLPETKGHSVEEVVQIFEKQAEASKAPV